VPKQALLERHASHRDLAVAAATHSHSPIEYFYNLPIPELVKIWEAIVSAAEKRSK